MNLNVGNSMPLNYLNIIANNTRNNAGVSPHNINYSVQNQNFQQNQVPNHNQNNLGQNQIYIQQPQFIVATNQNYQNQNPPAQLRRVNFNSQINEQNQVIEIQNNQSINQNIPVNLVNMPNSNYNFANVDNTNNNNLQFLTQIRSNPNPNDFSQQRRISLPTIANDPKMEAPKIVYMQIPPQNLINVNPQYNYPEKNETDISSIGQQNFQLNEYFNLSQPQEFKPMMAPQVHHTSNIAQISPHLQVSHPEIYKDPYNTSIPNFKEEKAQASKNTDKTLIKPNNKFNILLNKKENKKKSITLTEDEEDKINPLFKQNEGQMKKSLTGKILVPVGQNITIEPNSQQKLLNTKLDQLFIKTYINSNKDNEPGKNEEKNIEEDIPEIRLCNDAHYSIITCYSPERRLAYCDTCAEKLKEEGIKYNKIKEYISKYQEKLTYLLSISNHIIESQTFGNNSKLLKERLISNIEQKFESYIEAIQHCKDVVLNTLKKKIESFETNDLEKVQEISEELSLKSNEVRKTLITKRYLDMLSMINADYLSEKEQLLEETDETLKILKSENISNAKNTIIIPNFGIVDTLNKLSFNLVDNQYEIPNSEYNKPQKLADIMWSNNSRIYKHKLIDKMFTFSSNKPIKQNCLIEIKINKLSSKRIASIGFSDISMEINSGMFGLDIGSSKLAIFPNKLVSDKGNILNSELEFNENDIIYITIDNNEIFFKVNSSKHCYQSKNFRLPLYLCGTLFNKDDEIEIINIKNLKE